MDKLFDAIKEGHDSNNRIVFLCKDANGVFVFKPGSGFKSKHYPDENDEAAIACFDRQVSCGHVHAFYEESERPAKDEQYPAPAAEAPAVVEPPVVEVPAAEAPAVVEPPVV